MKQFPTAAFARANILPAYQAREADFAEIAELGAAHEFNYTSQINPGREAEGREMWERLQSRPTPGGNWLEDYTVASNSWID